MSANMNIDENEIKNEDDTIQTVDDEALIGSIDKDADNIKLNIKSKNDDDEDYYDDNEIDIDKFNKDEDEDEDEEEDVEEDVEEEDDDDEIKDPDNEDEAEVEDIISKSKSRKNDIVDDIIDEEKEEDEEEDEEEEDENYLKKFDKDVKNNFLESYHPEVYSHNFEEVKMLSNVIRDENNIIIDSLHKTIPFLTKFEKSRILGQRAKQIDSGAMPFVKVDNTVIEGYLIALKELEEKKIPFIIKRPLPNGSFEYWNVSDLELVC